MPETTDTTQQQGLDFSSIGGQPVPQDPTAPVTTAVAPTPPVATTSPTPIRRVLNPSPTSSSAASTALDFASIGGQPVPTEGANAVNALPATADKIDDTGFWSSAKRNTVGAIANLYHAVTDPATDAERQELLQSAREQNARGRNVPEDLATNPSQATLALHRLLTKPSDTLNAHSDAELAKAKEMWDNGEHFKAADQSVSGAVDKVLSYIPFVGPMVSGIANRAESGDFSGAATDVAALWALENAPRAIKAGVGKIADLHESMLTPPVEPPRPVQAHVSTPVPLDDATLGKFDKSLSKEAKQTIREHLTASAGTADVPAGSSVQNQMVKVVKPMNEMIQSQGEALNKILADHGQINGTASVQVSDALKNLKDSLPGGTEEAFGKAIDKEAARQWYKGVTSSDPIEINQAIRELDRRINSYTAPEDPLNTPADAADAARVTIRRILRDKLNTEIPESKPINDTLAKNLEVRNVLRKKLGDIANEPAEAEAQHASELKKGTNYMEYEKDAAKVARNRKIAGAALTGAAGTVGAGAAYKAGKAIFGE